MPKAKWLVKFSGKGKNAVVETIIHMRMKEGMLLTLEKPDELLITLNK